MGSSRWLQRGKSFTVTKGVRTVVKVALSADRLALGYRVVWSMHLVWCQPWHHFFWFCWVFFRGLELKHNRGLDTISIWLTHRPCGHRPEVLLPSLFEADSNLLVQRAQWFREWMCQGEGGRIVRCWMRPFWIKRKRKRKAHTKEIKFLGGCILGKRYYLNQVTSAPPPAPPPLPRETTVCLLPIFAGWGWTWGRTVVHFCFSLFRQALPSLRDHASFSSTRRRVLSLFL